MKLAFNTWVYSSFPVWVPAYPLKDTIERIARIGYDGVEIGARPARTPIPTISIKRSGARSAPSSRAIPSRSRACFRPRRRPGLQSPPPPLAAERANTIDQYSKVIRLCAELGGRTVLYVAGWQIFGTSREQAWDWSRTALVELADVARDAGVTLAIEPTSADSNLVDSGDDALRMMREADRPNVKLMFDTYHTLYRNEPPTDYVYRMGKDLAHIHLADSGRAAPSADGKVDYPALIGALRETGFDGYLTMEIGFDRRAVDPDAMARRAYDYIRPLL